uniref:Uncharacterized protein n=1 Tax=Salix viminalis TaxID=40686 RepID=A0A6N2LS79_SALVM
MFLMLKELLSHLNKNRSIMTVVVQKLFARSDFQKNWVFRGRIHMKIYFFVSCFWSIDVWLDIYMIYLITHHLTTMELHEGIRAVWLARKSGQSY